MISFVTSCRTYNDRLFIPQFLKTCEIWIEWCQSWRNCQGCMQSSGINDGEARHNVSHVRVSNSAGVGPSRVHKLTARLKATFCFICLLGSHSTSSKELFLRHSCVIVNGFSGESPILSELNEYHLRIIMFLHVLGLHFASSIAY